MYISSEYKKFKYKKIISSILILMLLFNIFACAVDEQNLTKSETYVEIETATEESTIETTIPKNTTDKILVRDIPMDFSAPYATYSIINSGTAVMYEQNVDYIKKDDEDYVEPRGLVVAVNAGHGTKGGSHIKTFSHPDMTPKVSGGTTAEGEILSIAVSEGTTLNDGTKEAVANLRVANKLKEKLLKEGFDVLMIRDGDDVQLDNIARTALANKYADCHIAIHFDTTTNDKGIFYVTPSTNESYQNMEPLKSNKENIVTFGNCLIEAFRDMGEKIWKDKGILYGDLTQLSYSTNASVDIELGDKATILTDEKVERLAEGLKVGIINYMESAFSF